MDNVGRALSGVCTPAGFAGCLSHISRLSLRGPLPSPALLASTCCCRAST